MKIEAAGHVIETKNGNYAPGVQFEIDDKEAEWLIKRGFAKKAGEVKPAPIPEQKPEQKPGGTK
ncbi:MAG: hypothetical protein LBH43_18010 [Treponema sp.]|jgi:hypothetical protein|nr:hypothetical protein [Treponema sp.]